MQVSTIDPVQPREDRLADAVRRLESGAVLALPTETFYGLSADSGHRDALSRLNRLKGKTESSPILLLAGDAAQAAALALSLPATFEPLVQAFWPGPLTLVLPVAPGLDPQITAGRPGVAVRVPGLAFPRAVARRLGRPITGVSANRYSEPPCRTAGEVAEIFTEGLDGILDGGPTGGGLSSTIVDLTRDPPRLLRAGLIPERALLPFLPRLEPPG